MKDIKEKRIKKNSAQYSSKGFTLLYSVLISSLLLSMGLAIFNIIIKELIISSTIRDSQIAFSAADTGAECALFWDLKYPGLTNGAFGGPSLGAEGLQGHWKLDDGTGATEAEDSTGNGHTGTLTNMDPNTDWTIGHIGGAIEFEGSTDHVFIDDSSHMAGTQALTISLWVKPDPGFAGEILTKRSTHYRVRIRSDGFPELRFVPTNYPTNPIISLTGNINIADGEWHHLVGVWDNGIATLYIDGVSNQSDVSPDSDIRSTGAYIYLGSYAWGTCPGECPVSFIGELDDVRIYNRALDPSEVDDLYTLSATETFDGQVSSGSGINCNEVDISSSWDTTGTDVNGEPPRTQTVFNIDYSNGTCSTVTVIKEESDTQIESRGYNSCDLSNPRRVERGLRVTY